MYRQTHPDDPGMHNAPAGTRYTRVTYRSQPTFGEQIRAAFVGLVVGTILLTIASGLLFWNEGRAVRTARMLDQGLNIVEHMASVDGISVHNEGKLVHLTGYISTGKLLHDPDYGVAVPAVHLLRRVELYQWVEHQRTQKHYEDGQSRTETTYDYSLEWRSEIVPSDSFSSLQYRNPTKMPVQSVQYSAMDVKVGLFRLSSGLTKKVTNYKKFHAVDVPTNYMPTVKLSDGCFFHGIDPKNPVAGDLRVTFEFAGYTGNILGSPDKVSVVARQLGDRLVAFETEDGDIELLYSGEHSAKEIFGMELTNNVLLTWVLRCVGWLIMFIAFNLFAQPLVALVSWVPIVRQLMVLGTLTTNACLAISLTLTVIALGWIRYRPLLGATIILIAILPFLFANFRARRRSRCD